jgi:hypothetical protein
VIREDKPLQHLLQNMLKSSPETRFDIIKIQSHPWVLLKHRSDSGRLQNFRLKDKWDEYRGMTLLGRLRGQYESKPEGKGQEWLTDKQNEEHLREQRNPNTRSNRTPLGTRERKARDVTPTRRVVRIVDWDLLMMRLKS